MAVIVDTTAGKVEGIEDAGILQFRGLPYAQAERFGPPRAPQPWAGVRDASRFGLACPQNPSATSMLLGLRQLELGEDCLVLNVYTPAADDGARPVLVWVHGGGFSGGSGHVSHYNGSNLARLGDVVVVTINYRLGALGFLHLAGVLDEAAGSGVNGLRDQIAALRWVADNIAAFGGDPGRVTVFGESAGAMSVATLLAVPEAAGLFHGAIAESGTAENILSPEAAAAVTEQFLAQLDLSPASAARLFDLPAEALLAAQTAVEAALLSARPDPSRPGPRFLQLPFQPVIDGSLIPGAPLDAVRAGRASGIPLVVGTTRDEWNLFALAQGGELTDERLQRRARRLVGEDRADEALQRYREAHPDASANALWCAMATDQQFRLPAIRLAEAQLPHAPLVAMYRFDYPSAAFGGLPGACHGIEIPFVFGNVDLPGIDLLLGGVDDGTRRLSDRCARAWVAMARTGRPEHADLEWPAYDLDRRATCLLDREPAVVDDPEGQIRELWEELWRNP